MVLLRFRLQDLPVIKNEGKLPHVSETTVD